MAFKDGVHILLAFVFPHAAGNQRPHAVLHGDQLHVIDRGRPGRSGILRGQVFLHHGQLFGIQFQFRCPPFCSLIAEPADDLRLVHIVIGVVSLGHAQHSNLSVISEDFSDILAALFEAVAARPLKLALCVKLHQDIHVLISVFALGKAGFPQPGSVPAVIGLYGFAQRGGVRIIHLEIQHGFPGRLVFHAVQLHDLRAAVCCGIRAVDHRIRLTPHLEAVSVGQAYAVIPEECLAFIVDHDGRFVSVLHAGQHQVICFRRLNDRGRGKNQVLPGLVSVLGIELDDFAFRMLADVDRDGTVFQHSRPARADAAVMLPVNQFPARRAIRIQAQNPRDEVPVFSVFHLSAGQQNPAVRQRALIFQPVLRPGGKNHHIVLRAGSSGQQHQAQAQRQRAFHHLHSVRHLVRHCINSFPGFSRC